MVRLLKSKKGGIPAINEIVQIVMGVLPNPIKFILFILLITTIASFIIPLFLGIFGYACIPRDDEIILYQVPMSKFVQKTAFDIEQTFSDIFTLVDYQIPEDAFDSGDKTYYKIPDTCYVTREINDTLITGYTGACTDCPVYSDGFLEGLGIFFKINRHKTFCIGDGYDVWTGVAPYSSICQICEPKEPYYYNHSVCINQYDQDNCYFTITDTALVPTIDEDYEDIVYRQNIESIGGVERPQDSSEFINIQCTASDSPSLFIFSIELFNRLMWIYLLIGGALVGFALSYYALYR